MSSAGQSSRFSSSGEALWTDRRGRALTDLRISVTDRCNFRCGYCMPRDKTESRSFLPRSEILDFEEITRVARLFVAGGVRKLRLTGGEPLLRKELPSLVRLLRPLGAEVALTTNGVLLSRYARDLKSAGLDRLTVSLDALDADVFQKACDAPSHSPKDVDPCGGERWF
jgi:cyclic pyranopterin phosphate synthase